MKFWIITETVRYRIEAETEEDALEVFVQSESVNDYFIDVIDRRVEEEQKPF